MGNALQKNWSEAQQVLYGLQLGVSVATSLAVGTILTQYCVFEWIWNANVKASHKSPAFLVSLVLFWALWATIFSVDPTVVSAAEAIGGTTQSTIKQRIATPILALAGFFLNLAFAYFWNCMKSWRMTNEERFPAIATGSSSHTDQLLAEHQDIDTSREPSQDDFLEGAAPPIAKPRPAKATVDYINNIKIFLTFMVFLWHCGVGSHGWPGLRVMAPDLDNWGTLILHPENWGMKILHTLIDTVDNYVLNLFFFYSGFFVPRSFDKKGRYSFLFDRVKRLGIPFVLHTYFLGPYVIWGVMKLLFGIDEPESLRITVGCLVVPGVTWFLNQLMIFSIAYAFACGKGWNFGMACPTIAGFYAIGLVLGLMSGIFSLFFTQDRFFAVPIFWYKYLAYIVYFFGGAVAQINGWMETIREKPRVAIYVPAAVVFVAANGIQHIWYAPSSIAYSIVSEGVLKKGLLSVGMSLAVSVFFMDYANKKYWCTDFFSKAMYTAYIIQWVLPIPVALKIGVLILDATGNIAYVGEPSVYSMYVVNDKLIFPIFLLVALISNMIIWPMAYAIRSIPGFAEVL